MRHVITENEAEALAREVLASRDAPIVVISTKEDGSFAFDPQYIARELSGTAEVVTLRTGDPSKRFQELLPARTQVFNGAARSYPADFGSDPRAERSPLRFPWAHPDDLIDDALRQYSGDDGPGGTEPSRTWASGKVLLVGDGTEGTAAQLDSGDMVAVNVDLLDPGLSLRDALVVGDRVHGWVSGRDLSPEQAEVDLSWFDDGAVHLARVTKVTEKRAWVSLHPTLDDIVMRRRHVFGESGADDDSTEEVPVATVLIRGDVIACRVRRDDKGEVSVTLHDVGDEEPRRPAPPIVADGGPWLREEHRVPRTELSEDQEGSNTAEPAVSTETRPDSVPADMASVVADFDDSAIIDQLTALRREVLQMSVAITRLSRENTGSDSAVVRSAQVEVEKLRVDLRDSEDSRGRLQARVTELQGAARARKSAARATVARVPRSERRDRWPDSGRWIRHEILLAWVETVQAAEKSRFPLPEDYRVGTDFVGSLEILDDGQFDKVMRTVVHVLTGRAKDIAGIELHRLRSGPGGEDAPVVRSSDGARSWRAAVEQNTSAARRLHYWELDGGVIELSRVVLHDDMTP
ncbi:hypothetical protein [Brevibacterium litoralis]|uniref:hypothetical protein n=1 Tax=Brevibacterium litoralis TaxID=3138935 RepID=UPI0032ECEB84